MLASAIAVVIASATAFADSATVVLDHQAPKLCPARDRVVEQLALRGVAVAAASDHHLGLELHTDPANARRWLGRVTLTGPATADFSRAVTGDDCETVTASLALIAAIALNPSLENAERPSPPPPARAPTPDLAARAEPVAPPPTGGRRWAGAAGHATTGMGPRLAYGLSAFFEHAWETAGVSLVLSATAVTPGRVVIDVGSVDLGALLGQADVCWFGGLLASGSAVLSMCAGFKAGTLVARGYIERPNNAIRPWAAPVLSARGSWALSNHFALVLSASAHAPLVRDRFVFEEPQATIFRTPAVGGAVEMGLARAF